MHTLHGVHYAHVTHVQISLRDILVSYF